MEMMMGAGVRSALGMHHRKKLAHRLMQMTTWRGGVEAGLNPKNYFI
jgi:hypothetical protein